MEYWGNLLSRLTLAISAWLISSVSTEIHRRPDLVEHVLHQMCFAGFEDIGNSATHLVLHWKQT